jgi:hypothetical protein
VRARRSEIDPWAAATWQGAEAETLAVGVRMTLAERLRWLEEMTRAARALASSLTAGEEIAESAGDAPRDCSAIT